MPCQLMVGFFAYAKSFEIRVDKKELEGIYSHLDKNEFDNCMGGTLTSFGLLDACKFKLSVQY